MSDVCPKCGSDPVEPGAYVFDWDCQSSRNRESEQCLRNQLAQANEKLNALLSGRMDEAEAKIGTRPAHVVVGELEADNILLRRENERLRFVAERVVRANKDVENHGYAPLRRLIRALEQELRDDDDTTIEEFDLPIHVYNALKRIGLNTKGDLKHRSQSIAKLIKACENLRDVDYSDAAAGGKVWYAEAIGPAVERVVEALDRLDGDTDES